MLSSCGDNSDFSLPAPEYSEEVEAWLQSCPGEIAMAVDWWNLEEYQNWTFAWPDEIYPTLEWVVLSRKINCYWFCKLFQKKFPWVEYIFVDQDGPYDHAILREGSPGNWKILSLRNLKIDYIIFEATNEAEFQQELTKYFKMESGVNE